MIDPLVRVAEPADAGQLAWLEGEARRTLIGQRGGDRWLETHPERGESWDAEIAARHVVVAHIDDVLVGYLVASLGPELAGVEEVYVTPGARELGFGDAMLEAATQAARAAGCMAIEGEALPGDRETKNLYERAGITARLIVVSKRL